MKTFPVFFVGEIMLRSGYRGRGYGVRHGSRPSDRQTENRPDACEGKQYVETCGNTGYNELIDIAVEQRD